MKQYMDALERKVYHLAKMSMKCSYFFFANLNSIFGSRQQYIKELYVTSNFYSESMTLIDQEKDFLLDNQYF